MTFGRVSTQVVFFVDLRNSKTVVAPLKPISDLFCIEATKNPETKRNLVWGFASTDFSAYNIFHVIKFRLITQQIYCFFYYPQIFNELFFDF